MFADDNDKREKQRQSSHDYRVKQKQKFETLEQQVQQLTYENQQLKMQNQMNDKIISQMCQGINQITFMVGKIHDHILGRSYQPGDEIQNQNNICPQRLQFFTQNQVYDQQNQQNHFSTATGTQNSSSIHFQQNSVQSGSFNSGHLDWPQQIQGQFQQQNSEQVGGHQFETSADAPEPSFFYSFSNHGNVFVFIFFVMLVLPSIFFPKYTNKITSNNTLKMLNSIPQQQTPIDQNQYVKLSLLENLIAQQQQQQNNVPNSSSLIVYAQNQSIEQFCKDNCEGKVQ